MRRLHQVEELVHHGADAGEEAGAELTFQDVGQLGRRHQPVALRLGVELGLIRGEHDVAGALRLQLRAGG